MNTTRERKRIQPTVALVFETSGEFSCFNSLFKHIEDEMMLLTANTCAQRCIKFNNDFKPAIIILLLYSCMLL